LFGDEQIAVGESLRDLAVLVAEVEKGSLVHVEDANYALLTGAIGAVKALLDRLHLVKIDQFRPSRLPLEESSVRHAEEPSESTWDSWGLNLFQEMDGPFWHTIAEHPRILGDQSDLVGLPEAVPD
jgi:hypothetical protein